MCVMRMSKEDKSKTKKGPRYSGGPRRDYPVESSGKELGNDRRASEIVEKESHFTSAVKKDRLK